MAIFDDEAEDIRGTTSATKEYLREIGQVALLTLEGEVEIAKRIERGEKLIITAILETPIGFEEISALMKKLEADELRLDSPHRRDQIIAIIKEIERKSQNYGRQARKAAAEKKTADEARQAKLQADLDRRKLEIAMLFRELRLDQNHYDSMVSLLRSWHNEFVTCQEVVAYAKALLKVANLVEFREFCAQVKKDPQGQAKACRKLDPYLTPEKVQKIGQTVEEHIQRAMRLAEELKMMPKDLTRILQTVEEGEVMAGDAREDLLEANLGLVIPIARKYTKYTNRGLEFMDLIQEGNIGLMKAVDKFEYKCGEKFSTYAIPLIHQAIINVINEQGHTILLPFPVNIEQREQFEETIEPIPKPILPDGGGDTKLVPPEFAKGDLVCLKSDSSMLGAVLDILHGELHNSVKILINNSIKTYYPEQLQAAKKDK